MVLGLGQCILYYEGHWHDAVTGEPCVPDGTVDRKTDRPAGTGPARAAPLRKPKSTIIEGVPDLYLGIGAAGVFMFMLVLALKR